MTMFHQEMQIFHNLLFQLKWKMKFHQIDHYCTYFQYKLPM